MCVCVCVCVYIIKETGSWFLEKINKTYKPLARLTKKKREKAQINEMRNERDVPPIPQKHNHKQLLQTIIHKLDHPEEMNS